MIENCKIKSTMLGYEGHGMLTCSLFLEGAGWTVSFGGYCLDQYGKRPEGRRYATSIGFQAITEILNTLEVKTWEELKGKYIRAESNGIGSTCEKIGHLMKDKWFSFREFFEQHENTSEAQNGQ